MTTKNQTQDTFHESKRSKEILGKHAMEGVSETVEKARKAHLKKGGTFIDSFKVPPYKSKRTTSDGYMPRTDKGKGLVGNSGMKGHGVNSPAMMKARSENKAKQRTAQ